MDKLPPTYLRPLPQGPALVVRRSCPLEELSLHLQSRRLSLCLPTLCHWLKNCILRTMYGLISEQRHVQ
jgi:hypothetical protein